MGTALCPRDPNMSGVLERIAGRGAKTLPWQDKAPARAELFGIERLEQHGVSLALAQPVTARPPPVPALHLRLGDNAKVLLAAYRASAAEVGRGRSIVPAAEWLLDNYHLVEAQIREVREDLPPGYYRQLPKLAGGPFAGYPRLFGLVWGFVAHTDSHFDPETLRRYLVAYQSAQPLTIGELWAVPITLRIVLIENLRRLADQMTAGRAARSEADALADAQLSDESPGPVVPPRLAVGDEPLVGRICRPSRKAAARPRPPDDACSRLAGGTAWRAGHRRSRRWSTARRSARAPPTSQSATSSPGCG